MPIYIFECQECGSISEFMLGLSEIGDMRTGDVANLGSLHCACSSCTNTVFKKLPTSYGKTAVNWGSWNETREAK